MEALFKEVGFEWVEQMQLFAHPDSRLTIQKRRGHWWWRYSIGKDIPHELWPKTKEDILFLMDLEKRNQQ